MCDMWNSSTNDAALESAIAGASEQYRHVCERDLQLADCAGVATACTQSQSNVLHGINATYIDKLEDR